MTPNTYYNGGIAVINGKRNAQRLAKMFNAEQIETRFDEMKEHVDGSFLPNGRYSVQAKNPGMDRAAFDAKCQQIYDRFNNK